MRSVVFSEGVLEDLQKIDRSERQSILKKIHYFASLDDPRSVASTMINYRYGQWRRRIGDWRVIFDIDEAGKICVVLLIAHRSKVYSKRITASVYCAD